MIALTTQLGDCELGLSSRQDDASTSSVAKYNGRNIATLPNEMLNKILSKLLDLQDVLHCKRVSQRWKRVIDGDYQIMPRAFYRHCHSQKHSTNLYTVEHYDSSIKGWLNKLGDEGKKSIMQLDQHVKNELFPQILCWSITQVLSRTKAFSCESIFTIEHSAGLINACFSTDGKHIMTASEDGTAKIYGLNDGQWQKKATIKHDDMVSNACFSADGKHLVTASWDQTAKIYGVSDGQWQEKVTIKHDHPVNSACFSADGKHLVTASGDQTAKIYGLNDGQWQEKATIKHDHPVNSACLSADEKHLVIVSSDCTAKIYGLNDGQWQEEATIKHDGSVDSACFSADGKHLVTASHDNTAKICGLNNGQWQEKATIKHDGPVNRVCFSPDGKYVMTASKTLGGINPKFVANVYMLIDKKSKGIS